MLLGKHMQNFRKLAQFEIPKNNENHTIFLIPEIGKTAKIQEIFRNSENQKLEFQGMLLECRMQNFGELTQLDIPKNQGELRPRYQASDEDYYYDKKLGSKSQ